MDFYILGQQLIGLALGSIYGLIAVGYTMVYGIIGMINFAHGDIYMVSAYLTAISIALLAFLGINPSFSITFSFTHNSGAYFCVVAYSNQAVNTPEC